VGGCDLGHLNAKTLSKQLKAFSIMRRARNKFWKHKPWRNICTIPTAAAAVVVVVVVVVV
jgi:negative regulator of sigma E activity